MNRTIVILAVAVVAAGCFVAARVSRVPKTALAPRTPEPAPVAASALPARPEPPPSTPSPGQSAPVPVATAQPWPLDLPPSSWPEPVRRTWLQLRERLTLDFSSESASKVMDWLSYQLGVIFVIDPELLAEIQAQSISMKVSNIITEGGLKLMLMPRGIGFEIQADGTIRLARDDKLTRVYEKEAAALLNQQNSLTRVAEALGNGWNCLDAELNRAGNACRERLRTTQAQVAAHNDPFEDVVNRLREETRMEIVIDAAIGRLPALTTVRSGTAGEVFDEIARAAGVGVVVLEQGVVLFCTPEAAEKHRAAELLAGQAHQAAVATLARPMQPGSRSLAEFTAALQQATGLPVVPSRELWESGASISIPAGTTARAALDASGLRWALHGDRLWLIR